MTTRLSRIWLGLLSLTLLCALIAMLTALRNNRRRQENTRSVSATAATATPQPTRATTSTPAPTATATPAPSVSATPSPSTTNSSLELEMHSYPASLAPGKLIVPVQGVRASDLRDTYSEARAEGRVHNAIDIMASRGTAVLAASDGEIARFFYSKRGGNTIYQWSSDKKAVFYYAHLEGYAEGLAAGQYTRQGQVIGYVGDTGNADAGNTHLHFSIWLVTDPKRYWDGININPYPILKCTAGC